MATPPKKKSSTKSGTAAKPGVKAGAKAGTKTAAKKAAPAKKRSRKKKSGGGALRGFLLSVITGMLLASAGFWGVVRITSGESLIPSFLTAGATPQQSRKASPAPTKNAQDKKGAPAAGATASKGPGLPPIDKKQVGSGAAKSTPPPDAARLATGPEAAAASKAAAVEAARAESASAPVSTPSPEVRPETGQTAGAQRNAPESSTTQSPTLSPDANRNSAVASALIDLKALPYEESLSAPLDERIRQVDYALMQAAWMKKLPASSMRLVSIEDRLEGVEPYQYQTIEILPGKSAKSYIEALQDCLSAWAETATLKEAGENQWAVYMGEVQTHVIRLFPGRASFAPTEQPEQPLAPQPRQRTAGQSAKMVIVIDDLGASPTATQQLLALDYPVVFAFWPHGNHTRSGAAAVHQAGLEVLVHQPMEPVGYPRVKPGPNVLLVSTPPDEIRRILVDSISKVPYAIGLNNHMGSRFTQYAPGVDVVIETLKQNGMFMLDSVTHPRSVFNKEGKRYGIEHYYRNVFLDVTATRSKILEELNRAERIALLTGQSVAIGHPLPETLAALKEWQRLRNPAVQIVRLRELSQE